MATKDDIARARYGANYDSLSVWGRRDIDLAFEEPDYTAKLPIAQEDGTLRAANVRLTSQLEEARQENLDLWDENSELKNELEELRSKFNPPSSSLAHRERTNEDFQTN